MIMTTMTFMLLMSAFHLRVPSDSIFLLLVAVSYHIFPRRLWSYSFVFVQGFRCPAVSSYTLYAPAVNSRRAPTVNMATSRQQPPGSADYRYLGACSYSCQNCRVLFWGEERSKSVPRGSRPRYNRCCRGGRVVLRTYEVYPEYMKLLLRDRHFLDNIRAYNQMGAQIDYSINNGRGPYVFKISGQLYHWIGSLCPTEGEQPRFLQLYIYDTANEIDSRMSHFGGQNSDLRRNTVEGLIDLLDTHNGLVQHVRNFRTHMFPTSRFDCTMWLVLENMSFPRETCLGMAMGRGISGIMFPIPIPNLNIHPHPWPHTWRG
ncbi:hypothetical protein Tco_0344976 [Tanacetum coccineum]